MRLSNNVLCIITWKLVNSRLPKKSERNKPCGFGLGNCHDAVQVTQKNKKNIVDVGDSALPSAMVLPNCKAYPSLSPFTFKNSRLLVLIHQQIKLSFVLNVMHLFGHII